MKFSQFFLLFRFSSFILSPYQITASETKKESNDQGDHDPCNLPDVFVRRNVFISRLFGYFNILLYHDFSFRLARARAYSDFRSSLFTFFSGSRSNIVLDTREQK